MVFCSMIVFRSENKQCDYRRRLNKGEARYLTNSFHSINDRQCYIRSLNSITETPYFSVDIENTHTSSKTCGKQAQYPESASKQYLHKKTEYAYSEMIVRCIRNLNNLFSGKRPYR